MEYAILVIVALAVAIYFLNGKGESKVASKTTVSKPKSDVPTTAQLKKLTKTQLFDLAEKKQIKVKKSGTKAEVIKQISSVK
jgi:hypothetical protein